MFADIASGNTGTADVLFLIAAIVFGITALISLFKVALDARVLGALVPVGLCLVAVAWLLL